MKFFNKIVFSVLIIIAIVSLKISFTPDETVGKLAVVFIETENSDSIFIKMPDGKTALIDGGLEKSLENIHGVLYKYKVKKLDYLINTHQHDDHIGTFPDLLKIYEVENFYMPESEISNELREITEETLKEKNVRMNIIKRGDIICDGDVKIEVLSPYTDEKQKKLNNYSAVLLLTYGDRSFLFTGDAENGILKPLVNDYGLSHCDVLKVSHHGSKNANAEYVLSAVSPQYAVVTAKDSDLKRLQYIKNVFNKLKTELYFTCDSGNVTMICDGKSIEIKEEREKQK